MTERRPKKWVGFDLDGTLAFHEAGASIESIGEPIPAMVKRVHEHMSDGYEVRIVTARVSKNIGATGDADEQREMIERWCEKHLGHKLVVTNEKDGAMLCLYDDRAIAVERNTGNTAGFLAGCLKK